MRYNYSKSQIFLLEFIIVVLFFAICTTICVSVFIKSDSISRDSQRDVRAMIIAQNAAECFKAGEPYRIEGFVRTHNVLEASTTIYYDDDFNVTEKEAGIYVMKISTEENKEDILTAAISIYERDESDPFFNLYVDKYIGDHS